MPAAAVVGAAEEALAGVEPRRPAPGPSAPGVPALSRSVRVCPSRLRGTTGVSGPRPVHGVIIAQILWRGPMATTSEIWFQRVMWVGIVANVALALPALLWPAADAGPLEASRGRSARLGQVLEPLADPAQQLLRPGGARLPPRQGQRLAVDRWPSGGRDLLPLAGARLLAFRRRTTSRSSCPRRCSCWEPGRAQAQ